MAKRKVKAVEAVAAPMVDSNPRMYIDLKDEDVELLSELKIGETVKVLITGKVVGINSRQYASTEGKTRSGDFQLEKFDVELANEGDFAALSEDD